MPPKPLYVIFDIPSIGWSQENNSIASTFRGATKAPTDCWLEHKTPCLGAFKQTQDLMLSGAEVACDNLRLGETAEAPGRTSLCRCFINDFIPKECVFETLEPQFRDKFERVPFAGSRSA